MPRTTPAFSALGRHRFQPPHDFIHAGFVSAQVVVAEKGQQDHLHPKRLAHINASLTQGTVRGSLL